MKSFFRSAAVKNSIKVGLVAGLLYLLGQRGFLSYEKTRAAFSHSGLMFAAIFTMLSTAFIGALRWQWLLRAQGIEFPYSKTLRLAFIGNFFNIALPGAVSGDVVKAFYVADLVPGLRGRAFGSILFDRIVGLSALVFVAAGALLLRIESLWGSVFLNAIYFFVVTAAVVVLCLYAYLFLVREDKDPLLAALKKLEKKNEKLGSLGRIYEGMRHYHSHRITVLKVLGVSILIHLAVGTCYVLFMKSLEVSGLDPALFFIVVPLGLLVTAVPVAPAGIGTGHYAFAHLFLLLGTDRGADVFTLFAICQLLIGAIGGLVYLRYKKSGPIPSV